MKKFGVFICLVLIGASFSCKSKELALNRLQLQDAAGKPTTSYRTTDPQFNLWVSWNEPVSQVEVKSVWLYQEAAGGNWDTLRDLSIVTTDTAKSTLFTLENSGSWPKGTYKVYVFTQTALRDSVIFNVFEPNIKAAGVSLLAGNEFIPNQRIPASTTTIFVNALLAELPVGTEINAFWYYVGLEGTDKPQIINQSELFLMPNQDLIDLSVTASEGWTPGRYQVEILINRELETILSFEVVAD